MIFALTLLLLFFEQILTHVMIEKWSNILIQNLISDLQLRDIALIIHSVKAVRITSYNTILKEIICHLPSVITNLSGLNIMKNENESFSTMIEPYLYSKLCIMLYDNTDVTNYSCIQCISELAELLPSTISRPSCLLI